MFYHLYKIKERQRFKRTFDRYAGIYEIILVCFTPGFTGTHR